MYRLIYRSKSAASVDWDCMRDIMHSSEEHNQQQQISGVLLASASHFLQIIEGKYEDVNSTFMRIIHDPRHSDIKLISFGCIDARLFEGWGMKGIGVFDFNTETADALKTKYGSENNQVSFPLEEWMVLAMVHDIHVHKKLPNWKR
ncbi:BLUF domain-containing protein [Agaribacterium haliotis]|uniref:BLUF domain-containing protein n=1 Tax=Agaribacterium haliotis TaxID=2013869 RepID=UPI000BB575B7|nr:BLUF domain-containing protein [Agaribacterium haliotis]